MKKACSILYITLILFSVFACTMPSELEITGSPSIKFAVKKNFSEYFDEMFDNVLHDDNPEVHILNCTNPTLQYKTFFIHIEAFRDDDYDCNVDPDSVEDAGVNGSIIINEQEIPGEVKEELDELNNAKKYFVLQSDADLPSPNDAYPVSFNDFGGYLDGFGFTGIKSKMYVSGSEIVDALDIKLYHHIGADNDVQISKNESTTASDTPHKKIDINFLEDYNGLDLPPGGIDIDLDDLINSREPFDLTYSVKIDAGTRVDLEWFDATQAIVVEIMILIPMEFKATEDEAVIDFNEYFNDIGDFFGKAAGTEYIESMNIIIGLKPHNPFGEGTFVIKDDNYSIKSPMDNNSFSFILSAEDLDYINNNEFIPGFSIVYKKGNTLGIPNENLIMSTISLHAKVKYNMEL